MPYGSWSENGVEDFFFCIILYGVKQQNAATPSNLINCFISTALERIREERSENE